MDKKPEIAHRLHSKICKNLVAGTRSLEGELLTLVDSSTSDPVQRKAFKDLVRKIIWEAHGYNIKDLDYYIEMLAKVLGEDTIGWLHPKGKVAGPKKSYNPLTD